MRRAWLVWGVLTLAACGEQAQEPVAQPVESASSQPEPAATGPAVALDIEGLRLVDPATGKTTLLAFGAERGLVQAALTRSTGAAPELSSNGECPAGPMEFARFGSLTLNFTDGRFAGWSADGDEPSFTTMDGIGVGSTRKEVEATRRLDPVEDSTLGYEFVVAPVGEDSALSLIFDGAEAQAKVDAMWAGVACNFR